MNVVLYARSAAGPVEAQLKELRETCQTNGYQILREYADENTSANIPLEERSQGKAMISFCRDGAIPVDGLMVVRRDRISRSADTYRRFERDMNEMRIHIITSSDIAVPWQNHR
jgi:DNA invertase Pin-like site-specific DNA recombinase